MLFGLGFLRGGDAYGGGSEGALSVTSGFGSSLRGVSMRPSPSGEGDLGKGCGH